MCREIPSGEDNGGTRGYQCKITENRYSKDVKKFRFSERSTDIGIVLEAEVKRARNIQELETILD